MTFNTGDKVTFEHNDGSRIVTHALPSGKFHSGHLPEFNMEWVKRYGWKVLSVLPNLKLPTGVGTVVRFEGNDGLGSALGWLANDGTWDVMTPLGDSEKGLTDPVQFLRDQSFTVDRFTVLVPQ